MGKPVYLTILFNILLLALVQSAPLPENDNDANFCDGIYFFIYFIF